jgi:hypothetical protein
MTQHTVYDVRAAAKHVAKHSDPHARATALFDTVHNMIRTHIEEAKQKQTVAEAVQVFEDTAAEFAKHRNEVIKQIAG